MSKTIGIAKKLRMIYEEDPSLFDKYSPEELIQMMNSMSISAEEIDDSLYLDEDPAEVRRYGRGRCHGEEI